MPGLVLLNGGPAVDKSTIARLWAARRPLGLALDIDVVRALLPSWQNDPEAAGLAARDLAAAMIRVHLEWGRDVIVPQYLARPEFIDRLNRLADEAGVPFTHVVLTESAQVTEQRFRTRAQRSVDDPARPVLQGDLGAESMSTLLREHDRFLRTRPEAVFVAAIDGDLPATLERLDAVIDGRGRD